MPWDGLWVLALVAGLWILSQRLLPPRGGAAGTAMRRGSRFPSFAEFEVLSPLHHQRAEKMLADFEATYQRTFGACDRNLGVDLHEQRARALASLYELRMRLPNDLTAYDSLTDRIEQVERTTLVVIDDVTQRCQMGLLHLGPVGDHYFAHWYRAAGETRE